MMTFIGDYPEPDSLRAAILAATHNAHTLPAVPELAGARCDFEFQRLHGMDKTLYDQVIQGAGSGGSGIPCRIYAPVGGHEDRRRGPVGKRSQGWWPPVSAPVRH